MNWRDMDTERRDDIRRGVTLLGAVMVALASGSNYVYSAYAPQLGSRLNISSTQINLIGMSGNLGVYLSGPVWGKLIDKKGPRIPLLIACTLLFIGYFGTYLFYTGIITMNLPASPSLKPITHFSTAGMCFLSLFMFSTGCGASGGLMSSMNSVAKSFPDSARATATGVTLAGFGLSAFLFSTIAHSLFPGDIPNFLLTLAIGTSIPMFLGSFIVRAVPLPAGGNNVAESGWNRIPGLPENGYEPLPPTADEDEDDDDGIDYSQPRPRVVRIITPPSSDPHYQDDSLAGEDLSLSRSRSTSVELDRAGSARQRPPIEHRLSHELSPAGARRGRGRRITSFGAAVAGSGEVVAVRDLSTSGESVASVGVHEVDVHGSEMFSHLDFWIVAGILTFLSGTGLCWINNVGSVTLALMSKGNPDYDVIEVAKYQAIQVSVISVWNCLGRVLMGIATDFAKTRFRLRRVWWACVTSSIFILSQICAQRVTDVKHLWMVSAVLGLGYGTLFSLLPIIVLEWFGLAHFAQNWGFVSLSPGVGGNLANLLFGRVYDSHVAQSKQSELEKAASKIMALFRRGGGVSDPSDHTHDCLLGQDCYNNTFKVTTIACCIALGLSLWAGVRRERQSLARRRHAREMAKWSHSQRPTWEEEGSA